MLYDDAVDRATSHTEAGVSSSGNNWPFCFSGVMTVGKHPATLTDTIFSRDLARRCSRSLASQKHNDTHVLVMGLPWELLSFVWSFHAPSFLPSALYLTVHSCLYLMTFLELPSNWIFKVLGRASGEARPSHTSFTSNHIMNKHIRLMGIH